MAEPDVTILRLRPSVEPRGGSRSGAGVGRNGNVETSRAFSDNEYPWGQMTLPKRL